MTGAREVGAFGNSEGMHAADSATSNLKTEVVIVPIPPPPKPPDSTSIVHLIQWMLIVVGWFVAYFLARRGKRNDDAVSMVASDVTKFLEFVEELSQLLIAHQAGSSGPGVTLEKSREQLTELRKRASRLHTRIGLLMADGEEKKQWANNYRDWKISGDGDTGLITNKKNAWTRGEIVSLENSNDAFLTFVVKIRTRLANRSLALAK